MERWVKSYMESTLNLWHGTNNFMEPVEPVRTGEFIEMCCDGKIKVIRKSRAIE